MRTRTRTKLHDDRPRWLDNAHVEPNRAVAAAEGWPEDITVEEALPRRAALNRAQSLSGGAHQPLSGVGPTAGES